MFPIESGGYVFCYAVPVRVLGPSGCRTEFISRYRMHTHIFRPVRSFEDELHNRLGIVEGVRVMIHSRLMDNSNWCMQFLHTLFENGCVFSNRHHLVSITYHVQDGDSGFCHCRCTVYRILFPVQRFSFVFKTVSIEKLFRIHGGTGRFTLSHRPTFEVHYGGICINTCHFFRVLCRPVIDNQPATTHPFKCHFLVESGFHHSLVKTIPALNSFIRAI